ncbi:purine-cytosine permease family protein [Luteococcus sp.]|uniref:purine-cytosine permease family protein n=1 Tax=Luteococcus sp. TaxID=1969402 RepID=UPI003736EF99
MSTPVTTPYLPEATPQGSRLVEMQGIDVVPDSERTARPSDLFWPWFAANVSVFGMTYGSYLLGFGISFWQATGVALLGIVLSFALCGIIAIAGKRGSMPTMVLSRSAFGVQGQKLPGIISWLTSIGWETSLTITATLATATVFDRLGWSHGTTTKVIACVVIAAIVVLCSVLGYHTIMKVQSILTWVTGAFTLLFMALTVSHIDWSAVSALPTGSFAKCVGALVMVMTGFGLGWINIAADWSRYQRRDASAAGIVFWNTFGGSVAPVLLVVFGLLLAGSDEKLKAEIPNDPIGALASILPTWVLLPFLLVAVLTLISGAVLGIYSSGLTLLSLGIDIPRPAAAALDGIILTAGTIYVVFFATSFLAPFQSFLVTLGVPLAAWAGVMIADILLRKRPYDEAALFDSRGRYGSVNWKSIAIMVVASVLGWGLVINQFSSESWNNWQGYLLEPLGLGTRVFKDGVFSYWDGTWPWANLGVICSLLIGLLGHALLNGGTIKRQEERA